MAAETAVAHGGKSGIKPLACMAGRARLRGVHCGRAAAFRRGASGGFCHGIRVCTDIEDADIKGPAIEGPAIEDAGVDEGRRDRGGWPR